MKLHRGRRGRNIRCSPTVGEVGSDRVGRQALRARLLNAAVTQSSIKDVRATEGRAMADEEKLSRLLRVPAQQD